VLAVAYATRAISDQSPTSAEIAIRGTVNPHCTIITDGQDSPHWVSDNYNYQKTSTGMSINFPGFANPDGTGNDITGTAYYDITANAPCTYVLTSSNGTLQNQTNAQAFRSYYANAHPNSAAGQPVFLDSISADRTVNSFTIDPFTVPADTVNIDVHIPASGVLAAGQYKDTLTMTVTPH